MARAFNITYDMAFWGQDPDTRIFASYGDYQDPRVSESDPSLRFRGPMLTGTQSQCLRPCPRCRACRCQRMRITALLVSGGIPLPLTRLTLLVHMPGPDITTIFREKISTCSRSIASTGSYSKPTELPVCSLSRAAGPARARCIGSRPE